MILGFTCREKKTSKNAAKWGLKIKLLSDGVPWLLRSFFDLAVQVLGWWVTATTPAHKGKCEPFQMGPKRSTSRLYCAS